MSVYSKDTMYVKDASGQLLYFRVVQPSDTVVRCYDYKANGNFWRLASYSSLNLTIKQGAYCELDNEDTLLKGYYHKGFKSGRWEYFDQKKCTHTIEYVTINKAIIKVWDIKEGSIIESGYLNKDSVKDGQWYQFFSGTDTIQWLQVFRQGKKDSIHVEFYRNGKIKRKEEYDVGKLTKATMYNEEGKKIPYYPPFSYPDCGENIRSLLYRKVSCFETLQRQQDLELELYISKEGQLKKCTINSESLNEACVQKIVEVLKKVKKWTPAKYENVPVNYNYLVKLRQYKWRD